MAFPSNKSKHSLLLIVLTCGILQGLSLSVKAQGLYIGSNTNFIGTGNVHILLNNAGLTNNGVFTNTNDTVIFTGNSATTASFIKGSNIIFNDVTINKSANDVQLNTNIAVNGSLRFIEGNLQLNTFTVNLGNGNGSIVGENNNARIIGATGGTVVKTILLNAPNAANPGNIGINITSTANLGTTTITRGYEAQTVSGTENGINRWFKIAPANNTALNATLQFNFFTGELNGLTEANLVLWSSANNGSTWSQLGETSINTTSNWVSKTGISSFNLFTLASSVTTTNAKPASAVTEVTKAEFTINKVFPNPASNYVNIEFTAPNEKDYEIALYAQSGQLLELKKIHANVGVNILYWSLQQYAAGVYYFVINNKLIMNSTKIIKAR